MANAAADADAHFTLEQNHALAHAVRHAEQAATAGDWPGAWRALEPFTRRQVPAALAGRLWETASHCAMAGAASLPAQPALTRALHAYQQEHDVPGMARAHAGLGAHWLADGEWAEAAREFGYAEQLEARVSRLPQRIGALCRQAEVSLLAGEGAKALMQLDGAMSLCRRTSAQEPGRDALEAQVRTLSAEAAALCGQAAHAARDLLWAERLANGPLPPAGEQAGLQHSVGGQLGPAAALALVRAEALLRLGYPRRAMAALMKQGLRQLAPTTPLAARAHAQRLLGAALLGEQPAEALALLQAGEQAFARLKQRYFRAACLIGMVHAARRCHDAHAEAYLEAARALRLGKWPQLARQLEQAKQTPLGSGLRVQGAVPLPWVREIGHSQAKPRDPKPAASPPADATAEPGVLGRLGHAVGRWRP